MCVVENEVLRARLKRNKELAIEIRHILQAPGKIEGEMILQKLNEIINGK